MEKRLKFNLWLFSSAAFLAIFFIYLFGLENIFIMKLPISGRMVYFPIPVLFFSVIFVFICTYSKLFRKGFSYSLFLILPLAVFWQLAFFLVEMIGVDPWVGKKVVFTGYSRLYLALALSFCLVISYELKKYLAIRKQEPFVVIPGVIFIIYLVYKICQTHSYIYILSIAIGYLIVYFLIKNIKMLRKMAKKELLFIFLIFVIAFTVRFAWGLRVISITGNQFYAASDDGVTYGPNAESWVNGAGGPSAFGAFGGFIYSIFLGLIYKFFGNANYSAAVFIQAILGALVPVCVYYIAKLITNTTIAKISAILVSFNMNSVFTSIVIGMEALFIPLVFIFLYLFIKYLNNKKILIFRYPFLLGALLGLANIVRFEILLFIIVIIFCLFLFKKNRFSYKDILKIAIPLVLGFSLILFSYCLRNYIKEGKFDFRTDSAAIGFCLVENNVSETKVLSDLGFNPFNSLGGALKIISEEPLMVSSLLLKGIAKKGFNFLFCGNFGEIDFLTLLNNSGIGECVYRYPTYCQFYIYAFVLIGLVLLFMNKAYLLEKSILVGYILYTILFYAALYTRNARYRAVLEPLFIILFANTVYFIITRFKGIVIPKTNKTNND